MKKRPHTAHGQRLYQSLLSCLLSLLLLFGATPKEFFHEFASHQDTQECGQNRDGLSFEQPHHHCDFLTFQLLPFAAATSLQWQPLPTAPQFPVWQELLSTPVFYTPVFGKPQRGPPAILA